MMNPNKRITSIIVGKLGESNDGEVQKEPEVSDSSAAKEHAGGKLIAAIESKDKMAVVSAIKDIIDICSSEKGEYEE